jgi:hypothetical protein
MLKTMLLPAPASLGVLASLAPAATRDSRLGRSSVPNRYGVARFVDEIGGDGGTHGAETDEADIHVRYSLCVLLVSRSTLGATSIFSK